MQITLAFFAVVLATLNIVGGFVVTDRMLEMFKPKPTDRAPKSGADDGSDDTAPGGAA
jgi:NAD(P) transhydrogenase subunit alpha